MKSDQKKTIRPTALQPKLFSVIKHLSKHDDYRVIVDRDNEPMCVMVSFSLWKNAGFPDRHRDDEKLVASMKAYYSDMPKEDAEWTDVGISDGLDYEN